MFKTAALSDRTHHNATAVTCQQDKNLDANTLDQAGDADRRHSNDKTAYYFYGNLHWKEVKLEVKT